MKRTQTDYVAQARTDAADTARHFEADILRMLCDDGAASADLNNDYPDGDGWHHENHVDRDYSLTNAADVLDQCDQWEETDNGLWHGLEPRKAVAVQAAYTYGACVYSHWDDLITSVNDDRRITAIVSAFGDVDASEDDGIDDNLAGAAVDDVLAEMLMEGGTAPKSAADRAEECGSPFAEALRAGRTMRARMEARFYLIAKRLTEVIDAFE